MGRLNNEQAFFQDGTRKGNDLASTRFLCIRYLHTITPQNTRSYPLQEMYTISLPLSDVFVESLSVMSTMEIS